MIKKIYLSTLVGLIASCLPSSLERERDIYDTNGQRYTRIGEKLDSTNYQIREILINIHSSTFLFFNEEASGEPISDQIKNLAKKYGFDKEYLRAIKNEVKHFSLDDKNKLKKEFSEIQNLINKEFSEMQNSINNIEFMNIELMKSKKIYHPFVIFHQIIYHFNKICQEEKGESLDYKKNLEFLILLKDFFVIHPLPSAYLNILRRFNDVNFLEELIKENDKSLKPPLRSEYEKYLVDIGIEKSQFTSLTKGRISSTFRKNAPLHHPDKLPPSASQEERDRKTKEFQEFKIKKDSLISNIDKYMKGILPITCSYSYLGSILLRVKPYVNSYYQIFTKAYSYFDFDNESSTIYKPSSLIFLMDPYDKLIKALEDKNLYKIQEICKEYNTVEKILQLIIDFMDKSFDELYKKIDQL